MCCRDANKRLSLNSRKWRRKGLKSIVSHNHIEHPQHTYLWMRGTNSGVGVRLKVGDNYWEDWRGVVWTGAVPSPVAGLGACPQKKNQFCAKIMQFWASFGRAYFFPILQQKVGDYPQSWKWGPIPCPPFSDAYGYKADQRYWRVPASGLQVPACKTSLRRQPPPTDWWCCTADTVPCTCSSQSPRTSQDPESKQLYTSAYVAGRVARVTKANDKGAYTWYSASS